MKFLTLRTVLVIFVVPVKSCVQCPVYNHHASNHQEHGPVLSLADVHVLLFDVDIRRRVLILAMLKLLEPIKFFIPAEPSKNLDQNLNHVPPPPKKWRPNLAKILTSNLAKILT